MMAIGSEGKRHAEEGGHIAAGADGPADAEVGIVAAVAQPSPGIELVAAEDQLAVGPFGEGPKELEMVLGKDQHVVARREG